MTDLPDPDRLGEDEPAVDVDEDENVEVVPPDVLDLEELRMFAAYYASNYAEPTHA